MYADCWLHKLTKLIAAAIALSDTSGEITEDSLV